MQDRVRWQLVISGQASCLGMNRGCPSPHLYGQQGPVGCDASAGRSHTCRPGCAWLWAILQLCHTGQAPLNDCKLQLQAALLTVEHTGKACIPASRHMDCTRESSNGSRNGLTGTPDKQACPGSRSRQHSGVAAAGRGGMRALHL